MTLNSIVLRILRWRVWAKGGDGGRVALAPPKTDDGLATRRKVTAAKNAYSPESWCQKNIKNCHAWLNRTNGNDNWYLIYSQIHSWTQNHSLDSIRKWFIIELIIHSTLIISCWIHSMLIEFWFIHSMLGWFLIHSFDAKLILDSFTQCQVDSRLIHSMLSRF